MSVQTDRPIIIAVDDDPAFSVQFEVIYAVNMASTIAPWWPLVGRAVEVPGTKAARLWRSRTSDARYVRL